MGDEERTEKVNKERESLHHNNKCNKSDVGFCVAAPNVFDVPRMYYKLLSYLSPPSGFRMGAIPLHCVPVSIHTFFLGRLLEQCLVHSPRIARKWVWFICKNLHKVDSDREQRVHLRMEVAQSGRVNSGVFIRMHNEWIVPNFDGILGIRNIISFISLHVRHWVAHNFRLRSHLNQIVSAHFMANHQRQHRARENIQCVRKYRSDFSFLLDLSSECGEKESERCCHISPKSLNNRWIRFSCCFTLRCVRRRMCAVHLLNKSNRRVCHCRHSRKSKRQSIEIPFRTFRFVRHGQLALIEFIFMLSRIRRTIFSVFVLFFVRVSVFGSFQVFFFFFQLLRPQSSFVQKLCKWCLHKFKQFEYRDKRQNEQSDWAECAREHPSLPFGHLPLLFSYANTASLYRCILHIMCNQQNGKLEMFYITVAKWIFWYFGEASVLCVWRMCTERMDGRQ